ncbi:MAG: alginate export family protein [Acidobacteriota bacterium]
MKLLKIVTFCFLVTGGSLALASPETRETSQTDEKEPLKLPSFHNTRYEEDWSLLRGTSPGSSTAGPLKFIPLNQSGSVYLSLGGQGRTRFEGWNDFGFGGSGSRSDGFGLLRLRVHGDLVLGPYFRVFVEGKSALSTNRDLPGGLRTLDVDNADLQNVFVDLRIPFEKGSATLRFGRQELQFGRQRLISPLNWSNTRPRMFDGFRGSLKLGGWRLDGFHTKFVRVRKYAFNRNNSGTEFSGLYLTGRPGNKLAADVYWIHLDRERSVWNGVSGQEDRHTVGTRLGGALAETGLTFDVEGAFQFGDHGTRDIQAFMFASELGYSFTQAPGVPRVQLGFDWASGDEDSSDGEANTFNQLFPLGHAFLGFIDIVGRQNIMDLSGRFSISPRRPFTVRLDGHFFWRADPNDALYNAGGGVVLPGNPLLSRRVGSEVDFTFQYPINRHVVFTSGYSHFFPGAFVEESKSAKGIDFGYVMVQYTF